MLGPLTKYTAMHPHSVRCWHTVTLWSTDELIPAGGGPTEPSPVSLCLSVSICGTKTPPQAGAWLTNGYNRETGRDMPPAVSNLIHCPSKRDHNDEILPLTAQSLFIMNLLMSLFSIIFTHPKLYFTHCFCFYSVPLSLNLPRICREVSPPLICSPFPHIFLCLADIFLGLEFWLCSGVRSGERGSGAEDKRFVNVTGHMMTGSSLSPAPLSPSGQAKEGRWLSSSEDTLTTIPVCVVISWKIFVLI